MNETQTELRTGFAFIMPCMGRKSHVQVSAKALLEDPRMDGENNHFVFVDYFCSEDTGTWVEQTFGERAHVLRIGKHMQTPKGRMPIFNKPIAQNSGAIEALKLGAQYYVFLDADTIVSPQLLDYVFRFASMDQFMIFEPNPRWRDLTGFLVVHHRPFIKVGGFNKDFKGWGAEDLEMRIHLYLEGLAPRHQTKLVFKNPQKYTMKWTEIPGQLAQSIPHADDARVANYEEKDKDASHDLNLNLLCSNVLNWTGKHPVDLHTTALGPSLRRLLGMDMFLNPRSLE